MITINNEPLKEAVRRNAYSKDKIAILAEISPLTLDKILDGDPNLALASIVKAADYLGFDVTVSFKKKAPVAVGV